MDIKNNKLLWTLIAVTFFNVGMLVVGQIIVEKTSDRVLEKLKKEYSPSPYGPGFDPDKVKPELFKSTDINSPQTTNTFCQQIQDSESKVIKAMMQGDVARDEWETGRGINPEQ